jgi:alpha-tubulin suppressor-like RCC1 family protein
MGDIYHPRPLGIKEFIIDVSGGIEHTLVLTNKGRVYAWGDGKNGALAMESTKVMVPTLVQSLQHVRVKRLFASGTATHSIAQLSDGSYYAWGQKGNEVLVAKPRDRCVPQRVLQLRGIHVDDVILEEGCTFFLVQEPNSLEIPNIANFKDVTFRFDFIR